MKTLVVTGGIGSGKSAVCSILEEFGMPVYDSDSRTKSLYDTNPALVKSIENAFGHALVRKGGLVDRAALALEVFSDSGKMSLLESIVHPAVLEDFEAWRAGMHCGVVGFESAIILEKPMFAGLGDWTLLVDAPVELRAERAMRRDGLSREKVLARMEGQRLMNDISEGRVKAPADFVIVNDGSLDSLRDKVYDVWKSVQNID